MPMTNEQYERLKRFLGLFHDWYMNVPNSPPSSHPLAVAEELEKKSLAKARSGLLMAVNDLVEMSSDWSPEQVTEADRRFIENSAPSLSEMRRAFSKQYRRVLKRGRINTIAEYYLVKGIVDGGAIKMDASESTDVASMLASYELQVTRDC
jgi:hypothetical protein